MTVAELQKLLENADPKAEVVVGGSDHSYRPCKAHIMSALKWKNAYFEDYGEAMTPEGPDNGKRVPVVLIQ